MKKIINFEPIPIQMRALELLMNNMINEVLFGGAASVGKTRLLVYWSIILCLRHAGIRGLWGRSRLSALRLTTLKTFFDISREWGLDELWDYNDKNKEITWFNGSLIILKDLFRYPHDPDYVSLGSLEISFAAIDEAAETDEKVYSILKTRIRYRLSDFNITPKLLIVSNPCQNWVYRSFYQPYKDETLEANKAVVLGLPTDNPYNTTEYLNMLSGLTGSDRQRLWLGNWDYADADNALFEYENLLKCFNNKHEVSRNTNNKYLTVDVAMGGRDNSLIGYWNDCVLDDVEKIPKNNTQQLVKRIYHWMKLKKINPRNVIIDANGVGKGVADSVIGCRHYISSNKAIRGNYNHLKSECFFLLAEKIRACAVNLGNYGDPWLDDLLTELRAYKDHQPDHDGPKRVTPKELVKRELGKSPDWAEMVAMRSYYWLHRTQKIIVD